MKKNKDLEYYINLPWTYTVETDRDKRNRLFYIISVNELPGIQTDAYSREKAFELIKDAMIGTFELYQELDKKIPEPNKKVLKGNITYVTSLERQLHLLKEAKKRKSPMSKIIDDLIDKEINSQKSLPNNRK